MGFLAGPACRQTLLGVKKQVEYTRVFYCNTTRHSIFRTYDLASGRTTTSGIPRHIPGGQEHVQYARIFYVARYNETIPGHLIGPRRVAAVHSNLSRIYSWHGGLVTRAFLRVPTVGVFTKIPRGATTLNLDVLSKTAAVKVVPLDRRTNTWSRGQGRSTG